MTDEINDLPPADPIAALTAQAVELHLAGQKQKASELFEARDGLARELYDTSELPSADNLIAEIEACGWQGETLIREWGSEAPDRVLRAVRFIQSSPELQRQFTNAPVHARPDIIAIAWAAAAKLDLPPAIVNQTPRAPDVSTTSRIAAQHQIDALLKENPPGTEGYRDPAVQRQLHELFKRVHGGGPIVGIGGRTV